MKRILYSTALLLAMMATACGDANQKLSALPLIDMNADYPEKEICLQDVAEVSYVPLETTDEFLFDGNLTMVSKQGIAVYNKDGSVMLFDADGKAKHFFNKKGAGPDNYTIIRQLVVDWKRQEVYVLDWKNIQVYSLDGVYKRTLKPGGDIRQIDMYSFSENELALFKEVSERGEDFFPKPYHPVVLMDKSSGEEKALPFRKVFDRHILMQGNGMTAQSYVSSLKEMGGKVYVNDVACDTLFVLDENAVLKPLVTRVPSAQTWEEVEKLVVLRGATSRYYLFSLAYSVVTSENQKVPKQIAYDRKDGEFYAIKFTSNDYASGTWTSKSFNHRTDDADVVVAVLQVHHLIEALEAGELGGELKTIAEGLKEEDNPVLMVVKFKE